MSEKTVQLNRRRVLGGIVTIGAAAAAAGAGTFAFFSDTENDTSTVDAGTLSLGAPTSANLSISDAVPGNSTSGTVTSTYNGSVDAEVDIGVTISESTSEPSEPSSGTNTELNATEFAQLLQVDTASVDVGGASQDLLNTVSDNNGNGYVDLDDLTQSAPFDAVTGSDATSGDSVSVTLGLTFVSSADNDAQADGVDVTVSLTAEQPSAD